MAAHASLLYPMGLFRRIRQLEYSFEIMSNKIKSFENAIVGKWIVVDSRVTGDEACQRVKFLTEKYLEEIGTSDSSGGWDTLYRDPEDGRYWERIYLESSQQGGGPPSLFLLNEHEAQEKYPNLFLNVPEG